MNLVYMLSFVNQVVGPFIGWPPGDCRMESGSPAESRWVSTGTCGACRGQGWAFGRPRFARACNLPKNRVGFVDFF